jgi:hypothetical protein
MNLSSYFPKNFQPSLPIVLLAGRGNYPRLVWQKNVRSLSECANFFVRTRKFGMVKYPADGAMVFV